MVTDLLVFEHGVIEEVYDRLVDVPVPLPEPKEGREQAPATMKAPASGAQLTELVALHGASIGKMNDQFGRVFGYTQDLWGTLNPLTSNGARMGDTGAPAPMFSRDQIVSFSLFPNTSGRSAPLIESIVNEVITIMRSSEHTMLALDADEIPPGILVLTGVAGKAAESAKSDLQRMKGKDHKIRVITNPDPRGSGAHWVELRRTPKDLSLIDVVREVRRTIWRIFGVMPIEMGDSQDMPRAVGQVQLDVSSSHLVEPILDLLEAKVNARVIPPLVRKKGGPDGVLALRFDREAKLSPQEQKDKATAVVTLVREGILTRNEARQEIDKDPIDGGDIATITTSGGLVRVDTLDAEMEDEPPETGPPEDGTPDEPPDDEPPDDAPPDGTPDPGEEAPGENGGTGPGRAAPAPVLRVIETPSSWPSASLFKGRRTVALDRLADSVSRYTREVRPLYREAADEVVAAVSAIYDGSLRPEDAQRATDAIGRALDRLSTRWAAAAAPVYREVARSARDQAADFTSLPVVEDWSDRADRYADAAMHYLSAPGGLISDIRASLIAILARATADSSANRMVVPVSGDIAPHVESAVLLAALAHVFDTQEHRIENWSGKLVELASEVLAAGMNEGSAEAGEWYYEWVAVGDGAMCAVCSSEGTKGFRPASQLTIHPGSSTNCRARCRCVLVWWTRDEVASGVAVRLSGNAPGNAPL